MRVADLSRSRAPPLLSRRNHKNERNPEKPPQQKQLSYIFVFSQVGTMTTITTTTRALCVYVCVCMCVSMCKLEQTGDGGSGTFVLPGHKNQHMETGGQ